MKEIRIGVLGGFRGRTMMNFCLNTPGVRLAAVCDSNSDVLRACGEDFAKQGAEVRLCADFDDLIGGDLDAVVLANFADQHAPFAVRCLERGLHVLSEVLPVHTLGEAVALCEAVEKSGRIYGYAENYCYFNATREMTRLYRAGELGDFEYGEGEYIHDCEPIWPSITYGDPDHWRNRMHAFFYCTHSVGPILHATGLRPVRVSGFEVPYSDRQRNMGALGAPAAVEMITLENGGLFKSVHGVGLCRNSIWYTLYGSRARAESFREHCGGVEKLQLEYDELLGIPPKSYAPSDEYTALAEKYGHAGGDFYTMLHFIRAIRGEENDLIGVYEALDMAFAGIFGFFSALEGGKPMEIPDFRDPRARERFRGDTRCTDPKVAGKQLLPTCTSGTPDIPAETYRRVREAFEREKNKK